jgi:hypothetical protein
MFRSYDHLHVEIFTLEIGNFRILANFVNNGDRSLVTVDVIAVAELTIAYFWCG